MCKKSSSRGRDYLCPVGGKLKRGVSYETKYVLCVTIIVKCYIAIGTPRGDLLKFSKFSSPPWGVGGKIDLLRQPAVLLFSPFNLNCLDKRSDMVEKMPVSHTQVVQSGFTVR